MSTAVALVPAASWRDYWELTKPRVVAMLMITAMVGMALAPPVAHGAGYYALALLGLWAGMSSAAVINQWVDQRIDAVMARTQGRPLVQGTLGGTQALAWAALLAVTSMLLLGWCVNPLTAWLTAFGMVGYAGVYTRYLKRATPQNIVIGGLSGALPPLLGWSAVTGSAAPEAWLLVLLIFVWTPPHFWALAIHRRDDYARAGIPMLPVTHGVALTRELVWYYTILLTVVSLLPYLIGMSGLIYAGAALLLGFLFMREAWRLRRDVASASQAMRTFRFSIIYLLGLFVALLVDHCNVIRLA